MYAIYAYIGVVLGVNVGIYGIHGVFGTHRLWEPGTCTPYVLVVRRHGSPVWIQS